MSWVIGCANGGGGSERVILASGGPDEAVGDGNSENLVGNAPRVWLDEGQGPLISIRGPDLTRSG